MCVAFDSKPTPGRQPGFLFPLGHRREFSLIHICKHSLSPNHGPGSVLGTRDAETIGPVCRCRESIEGGGKK